MTSNHRTVNVETKNRVNKMITLHHLYLESYAILYHIYLLLICKGHIQMTSNHSTINVETKKTIE